MTDTSNPTDPKEIARTAEWFCATCGPVDLNNAGRCSVCDSDNLAPILAHKETRL